MLMNNQVGKVRHGAAFRGLQHAAFVGGAAVNLGTDELSSKPLQRV